MTTLLIWDTHGSKPLAFYIVSDTDGADVTEDFVLSCDGQYLNAGDIAGEAPIWQLDELISLQPPGITPVPRSALANKSFSNVVVAGVAP